MRSTYQILRRKWALLSWRNVMLAVQKVPDNSSGKEIVGICTEPNNQYSMFSHSSFAALAGAFDAVVCWHHARGGEGAVDLAKAIAAACEQPAQFKFLYPLELSIKV